MRILRIIGLTLGVIGNGVFIQARETPAQIRRIVAQSICLSVAYPNSEISHDAEGVYSVYAGHLGLAEATLARRKKIEALAKEENPAKPTPVGQHNLALAKCSLFAERADVQALLQ